MQAQANTQATNFDNVEDLIKDLPPGEYDLKLIAQPFNPEGIELEKYIGTCKVVPVQEQEHEKPIAVTFSFDTIPTFPEFVEAVNKSLDKAQAFAVGMNQQIVDQDKNVEHGQRGFYGQMYDSLFPLNASGLRTKPKVEPKPEAKEEKPEVVRIKARLNEEVINSLIFGRGPMQTTEAKAQSIRDVHEGCSKQLAVHLKDSALAKGVDAKTLTTIRNLLMDKSKPQDTQRTQALDLLTQLGDNDLTQAMSTCQAAGLQVTGELPKPKLTSGDVAAIVNTINMLIVTMRGRQYLNFMINDMLVIERNSK